MSTRKEIKKISYMQKTNLYLFLNSEVWQHEPLFKSVISGFFEKHLLLDAKFASSLTSP